MRFQSRPRFSAKRTPDCDGVVHASKGQAAWFSTLKQRARAGQIADLELEPAFSIKVARDCPYCAEHGHVVGVAKADARFVENGLVRVKDYKGVEGDTPLSRFKRRLVRAMFGVDIEIEGPARELADRRLREARQRRENLKAQRQAAKAKLQGQGSDRKKCGPPAL